MTILSTNMRTCTQNHQNYTTCVSKPEHACFLLTIFMEMATSFILLYDLELRLHYL